MEKRISVAQFQAIKRVAQACSPIQAKRATVKAKIDKLQEVYDTYTEQIDALCEGVENVLGVCVDELVKKVVEPGVDYKGNPTKNTRYLPTDIVTYDPIKKQYIIKIPCEDDIKVFGEPGYNY